MLGASQLLPDRAFQSPACSAPVLGIAQQGYTASIVSRGIVVVAVCLTAPYALPELGFGHVVSTNTFVSKAG